MYLAFGARALAAGALGVAVFATAAAGLALTGGPPPGTSGPAPRTRAEVSFRQGGRTHRVRGFSAGSGYNLAAGLGTVNAADFVPELAHLAG
jgi:hypothetical protein